MATSFSLVLLPGGAWPPFHELLLLRRAGSRACRLSSCGTWASLVVARGLSCPAAGGSLVSQPGIKPKSPALEGGFLITGPPGKSPQS